MNDPDFIPPQTSQGAHSHSRLALCLTTALLAVALDQASKLIVERSMYPGQSISLIGDSLRITFIYNPGGLFGMTLGGSAAFTTLSLVAVVVLVIYLFIARSSAPFLRFPLSLIFGGAVGNLIDRIRAGKVTDLIDVNIPDITLPELAFGPLKFSGYHLSRWPVFNVADIAITCGILLFIVISFSQPKAEHRDGPSAGAREEQSDESGA